MRKIGGKRENQWVTIRTVTRRIRTMMTRIENRDVAGQSRISVKDGTVLNHDYTSGVGYPGSFSRRGSRFDWSLSGGGGVSFPLWKTIGFERGLKMVPCIDTFLPQLFHAWQAMLRQAPSVAATVLCHAFIYHTTAPVLAKNETWQDYLIWGRRTIFTKWLSTGCPWGYQLKFLKIISTINLKLENN